MKSLRRWLRERRQSVAPAPLAYDPAKPTYLAGLAPELLFKILGYLTAQELLKIRRVCRDLVAASEAPEVWNRRLLKEARSSRPREAKVLFFTQPITRAPYARFEDYRGAKYFFEEITIEGQVHTFSMIMRAKRLPSVPENPYVIADAVLARVPDSPNRTQLIRALELMTDDKVFGRMPFEAQKEIFIAADPVAQIVKNRIALTPDQEQIAREINAASRAPGLTEQQERNLNNPYVRAFVILERLSIPAARSLSLEAMSRLEDKEVRLLIFSGQIPIETVIISANNNAFNFANLGCGWFFNLLGLGLLSIDQVLAAKQDASSALADSAVRAYIAFDKYTVEEASRFSERELRALINNKALPEQVIRATLNKHNAPPITPLTASAAPA